MIHRPDDGMMVLPCRGCRADGSECHLEHGLDAVVVARDAVHVHAAAVDVFDAGGDLRGDVPYHVGQGILGILVLLAPGRRAAGVSVGIVAQVAVGGGGVDFGRDIVLQSQVSAPGLDAPEPAVAVGHHVETALVEVLEVAGDAASVGSLVVCGDPRAE